MEGPVPITIEVKDINDNRPMFLQQKYEGSVRQNSRPGKRQESGAMYGKVEGFQAEEQICVAKSCSITHLALPVILKFNGSPLGVIILIALRHGFSALALLTSWDR